LICKKYIVQILWIPFLLFYGGIVLANDVDRGKLDELRVKTIVSGDYLKAWNLLQDYFSKNGLDLQYSDYSIVFSESETDFIIKLSKPFKAPILGGGVGTFRINKLSYSIKGKLIR